MSSQIKSGLANSYRTCGNFLMGSVIDAIERIPAQKLGLARCLFSFELEAPEYNASESSDSSQMRIWKALEAAYIDEFGKPLPTIDEPLWAIFQIYLPMKMASSAPAIGELIKAPERALVQAGVIKTRALIKSYDLSRKLVGNSQKLCIFLMDYDGE